MAETVLARARRHLSATEPLLASGRVEEVVGLSLLASAPPSRIGEVCLLYPDQQGEAPVVTEVVGFRRDRLLLMPYETVIGLRAGARVVPTEHPFEVQVGDDLLGRVLDGMGRPLDGRPLPPAGRRLSVRSGAPSPLERPRIQVPLPLGVRVIDSMTTVGEGQRIGIFAGSGVGKSTLLGMIARRTAADRLVIALVGERGREVRDFLEEDLGPALDRSVVIVATSDQPAMMRALAAEVAHTVAEAFREDGHHVLLLMDSLTRYATALREVGLAIGEPATARGYPPSVFAALPRLLERAGRSGTGSITGIYTVLVDGDDPSEPIADGVRAILDGHILLDRSLAQEEQYPAVDVLRSLSRVMPQVSAPTHRHAAERIRSLLAVHEEYRDLLAVGAYRPGAIPLLDRAVSALPRIRAFFRQTPEEDAPFAASLAGLEELASGLEEAS